MCGCPCNISVKIAYLRLAIIDTLKEDASIATERVKILEGEEQGPSTDQFSQKVK